MKSVHSLDGGEIEVAIHWDWPVPATHKVTIVQKERGSSRYPRSHRPATSIEFSSTSDELRELVRTLERLL